MIRLVALAVAFLGLHGQLLGQSVSGPTLEPRLVRIGAVGHRDERTVEFSLHNPGTKALVFTKVKVSCDCMKVQFDQSPLPAGETRTGTVTISFGRGFGNFKKHVDFQIQGRRSPLSLHVFANFHPGIICKSLELVLEGFQPSAASGGDTSAVEPSTPDQPGPTAILIIESQIPKGPPPTVTDIRWARGGEHLRAKVLEPTRNAVRIEVSYADTHPEGPISAELNAVVDGRKLVMPVRGNIYRGVRLHPPQANFSVVREPTDRVETIELIPADPAQRFEITATRYEPRPNSPALEPKVTKKPRPGGGWIVTLTIEPEPGQKGGFGGNLVLTTDHPEKPEIRITVFGHLIP